MCVGDGDLDTFRCPLVSGPRLAEAFDLPGEVDGSGEIDLCMLPDPAPTTLPFAAPSINARPLEEAGFTEMWFLLCVYVP